MDISSTSMYHVISNYLTFKAVDTKQPCFHPIMSTDEDSEGQEGSV